MFTQWNAPWYATARPCRRGGRAVAGTAVRGTAGRRKRPAVRRPGGAAARLSGRFFPDFLPRG